MYLVICIRHFAKNDPEVHVEVYVHDRYMFAKHVPALKPLCTKAFPKVEVYV